MKRIALVSLVLLAAAAVAGVGLPERAAAVDPADGTITVTGTGAVVSVPDQAELSFGVESQAASAKGAVAANAAEMRRLIDALKGAGAKDVTTQTVSVSPRYKEGAALEIAGYSASNAVTVTIAVSRAGALIDAGAAAGANQIYGPTMSSTDADRLYRGALKAAFEDARAHAGALAAVAGASVGRVVSVVEGGNAPSPVFAAKAAADAASTPIEPGPQRTTASVTVTFALA
jgi:uncharacterized protein